MRTSILRTGAVLLAIAGAIDPAWRQHRELPVPVGIVEADPADAGSGAGVEQVQAILQESLRGDVAFNSPAEPAAVVLVGDRLDSTALPPEGLPASTVLVNAASHPNVKLLDATIPASIVGRLAYVIARIHARLMTGAMTIIALEHEGMELAHVTHQWTRDDEQVDVRLPYVPVDTAMRPLTVVARPHDRERTAADNSATVLAVSEARRLRVLVHELRPSWAVTFIRRALEADPLFDVSGFVRASSGTGVRAGNPPPSLTSDRLADFDLVIAGAPEELRARDISALTTFMRVRGGAVAFVADRRPAGPYTGLIPADGFDEVLLPAPVSLDAGPVDGVRGSEFAVPHRPSPGVTLLARLEQDEGARAVVVGAPSGAGRLIFSGLLDAWRYRRKDGGYSDFWRAHLADAAAASPRRIELSLDPAAAAPGRLVTLRATLRETEFRQRERVTELPAVRARIIDGRGAEQRIRLWPTAVAGVFEARWKAPAAGRYDVQMTADSGASRDTILMVDERATVARASDPEGLALLATASGGVAASVDDLGPLEAWLRGFAGLQAPADVHPTRSSWWMVAFIALAGAEWTLGRTAERRTRRD